MKNKIINYILNNINKENYNKEKIEYIKYGLEALYLTLTKLIIILLIALLFNVFIQALLLIMLYAIIKAPSFGMHANSSKVCLILSTGLFIFPLFFMKSLEVPLLIKILTAVGCLITFALYAPADTVKRPLINKEKRTRLKKTSLIIAAIYIILAFIFTNNQLLSNVFLYALVLQGLIISPVFYKLNNQPYQNYKNYKKEVLI